MDQCFRAFKEGGQESAKQTKLPDNIYMYAPTLTWIYGKEDFERRKKQRQVRGEVEARDCCGGEGSTKNDNWYSPLLTLKLLLLLLAVNNVYSATYHACRLTLNFKLHRSWGQEHAENACPAPFRVSLLKRKRTGEQLYARVCLREFVKAFFLSIIT